MFIFFKLDIIVELLLLFMYYHICLLEGAV